MRQVMLLIVVVALALAGSTAGCSRPAQPPAGQTTATPAAQTPETAAAAQPAGAQPAAGQPSTPAGVPGASAANRPSTGAGQPVGSPAAAAPQPEVPPEPPKPRVFTLAAGTTIQVETTSSLSTKTNKTGEPFSATLVDPIADGDWVIAAKGAAVSGVVVSSDPGGRVKGLATLTIGLKKLTLADNDTVALATSTYEVDANTSKKKDAAKVAVGGGVGAIVGGIAGGGKGAGIGAATGAAAGTALVLGTRGDPAVIPAGSVVSFKLTEPITVTKK